MALIKQQLQDLVVREAVQAVFQKALAHAIPVPVVDAHVLTPAAPAPPDGAGLDTGCLKSGRTPGQGRFFRRFALRFPAVRSV